MLAPRPVHLFICLIALVIAGCAHTGVERTQTSAGGEPPRPKTVLVYDFVFSSDIAVVDPEFTAQLNRQIGNLLVSKQLISKRVNDEIVATIITILHYEAGLDAQPGSEEDVPLKDGALVISGQLHAVDQGNRPQRNSVGFGTGGGVVADMTVSQISEGTKKQLFIFTTQAPSGRRLDAAMTGPAAVTRNAAIAAALAAKSAPAVNLSPNVEAQARGLGRAVADKIVAYAVQQGWVSKADLPEQPMEKVEKLEKVEKKLKKLSLVNAKQGESPLPSNTIPCSAFTKNYHGNWYVKGPVTFNLGSAENKTLQNLEIPPKFFTIGGVDLYEAIQKKCSSNPRP